MRRVAVIGVLTSALATLLAVTTAAGPASACGCGAIVGPADTSASAVNEQVILSWNGEQETMELSFDVSSDSVAAGLIIPTPSPATVDSGDPRTFALLENLVLPVDRFETDIWGVGYLHPEPEKQPVTVLDRVRLGELEATTLAASDSAGLTVWLSRNDFEISEDMTKSLESYVELGWSFTAVKLVADSVMSGQLDPLRLTFSTDRLVYPMRLAKMDSAPHDVRLYVFDIERTALAEAGAPTRDIDATVTVVWAGEPNDARLDALGAYLTVFDVRYDVPEEQATSDIGVVSSTNQTDHHPEVVHYRMVTLLGMPVGTLTIIWFAIGIGIAAAHLRGRRRAR